LTITFIPKLFIFHYFLNTFPCISLISSFLKIMKNLDCFENLILFDIYILHGRKFHTCPIKGLRNNISGVRTFEIWNCWLWTFYLIMIHWTRYRALFNYLMDLILSFLVHLISYFILWRYYYRFSIDISPY
jgi:hypothetical protein